MQKKSTLAPDALKYLTGEGSGLEFPAAISSSGGGGKFDHNGDVLTHPGNTFICHIDKHSGFYHSLSNLQEAIRALPLARYMTFLPKPSFHMTIFCGLSGDPLGVDGWPEGIQPGRSLESISNQWHGRLVSGEKLGGFSMHPSYLQAPYRVSMQPASDEDADALLDARQRLENLTGLVRGDVQSYQFHVTLSYMVKWMSVEDAKTLMQQTNLLFSEHVLDNELVKLGPVEFCTFDSMHRFTPFSKTVG